MFLHYQDAYAIYYEEGTMLGATEFTIFGNVVMGFMAVLGVIAMLYGLGVSLRHDRNNRWKIIDTSTVSERTKKAA